MIVVMVSLLLLMRSGGEVGDGCAEVSILVVVLRGGGELGGVDKLNGVLCIVRIP